MVALTTVQSCSFPGGCPEDHHGARPAVSLLELALGGTPRCSLPALGFGIALGSGAGCAFPEILAGTPSSQKSSLKISMNF